MNDASETTTQPSQADIDSLIRRLDCEEMPDCQKSRQSLVEIGSAAVPALVELLKSPKEFVRWEAAKALGQIGDKAAIPAMVNSLEDTDADVRWLAAVALIRMGTIVVVPLLQALVDQPESFWLYEGAHHVLTYLARRDRKANQHPTRRKYSLANVLEPVVVALESIQPSVEAPGQARMAMDAMKG
jgi:HEAT repeat protein